MTVTTNRKLEILYAPFTSKTNKYGGEFLTGEILVWIKNKYGLNAYSEVLK